MIIIIIIIIIIVLAGGRSLARETPFADCPADKTKEWISVEV